MADQADCQSLLVDAFSFTFNKRTSEHEWTPLCHAPANPAR